MYKERNGGLTGGIIAFILIFVLRIAFLTAIIYGIVWGVKYVSHTGVKQIVERVWEGDETE